MPKIQNMGRSTVRFNEGVIISGSAGSDVYALSITGSSYTSDNIIVDGRIGIGSSDPAYKLSVGGSMEVGEYIYHKGDINTYIRFQDDDINLQAGGRSMVKISEGSIDQVLIMSGGAASSHNVKDSTDTNFFVSGSIGSAGSSDAGTSVFGGDVVVSGSANISTDLSVEGIATYNTVEYFNSNTMKFNQNYLGNANGSYFSANEYQKVLTIIPSANSQNYQVIGRITAQNAGETHVVNFNAALRSGDPLPDLSWSISYDEEYNGSRYIDPQLWTKETTTAGFIFAFKTLATIYGNVTVDIDVVPRSSSQKANVTINNSVSSEQTSIDAGYTANDMIKVISKKGSSVTINNLTGSITNAVSDVDGNKLSGGIYQLDDGLIQNPNSGYSRIFFPADDTLVETVGAVSTNYKIAPFNGELIKMQVKSIQDFTGKTLTAALHVGAGTVNAYSTTPSVSVTLNGQAAHSVYTFDFLGQSGTTFNEGNIFGFSLQLSENWAGNETIHFTSVVRFNPYV